MYKYSDQNHVQYNILVKNLHAINTHACPFLHDEEHNLPLYLLRSTFQSSFLQTEIGIQVFVLIYNCKHPQKS